MNTSFPKLPQALCAALLRGSSRFRLAGAVLLPVALAMTSWSTAAVAQCQPEWLAREWFSVGTIGTGYLHDVEVVSNGDLVVCGDFLLGSGQLSRIARWDGLQWGPLGPGLPTAAWCMTELPDGRLAVGVSNGVMAWDGAAWTQLGGAFDSAVKTMTIRNGELVAAGGFTLAGGNPANRIARWDGTGWVALGTGITNGLVHEITTLTNGDLIAAGSFTSPGRFVARWNGTNWAAMGTGPGSAWTQEARTVAQDPVSGSIYLAGDHGTISPGFVDRWNGSAWVSMYATCRGTARSGS